MEVTCKHYDAKTTLTRASRVERRHQDGLGARELVERRRGRQADAPLDARLRVRHLTLDRVGEGGSTLGRSVG